MPSIDFHNYHHMGSIVIRADSKESESPFLEIKENYYICDDDHRLSCRSIQYYRTLARILSYAHRKRRNVAMRAYGGKTISRKTAFDVCHMGKYYYYRAIKYNNLFALI